MGRWTQWRHYRAARIWGSAEAIRCPDCGVVSRRLKPRRVPLGTSDVGMYAPYGESGGSRQGTAYDLGQVASKGSDSAAGKNYVVQYRCPACKTFFSARQAGLPE
ncbi:MAG TPA: hypothetical protein VKD47_09450 [Miltoncostaeaceae bacterium]|nr:hypothetical protein [Miltoncostaeaceae bacterium]